MARVDSGALPQRPMGSASELPLDLTVIFPDAGILSAVSLHALRGPQSWVCLASRCMGPCP